ncbi:hypothetical protein I871_02285 [Borrelia miyamotoi LB-2001]|nr:hypothetical protein I871_02285 [Borrelia miyamotoi LB-2001]
MEHSFFCVVSLIEVVIEQLYKILYYYREGFIE